MTFLEAAIQILKENGNQPMKSKEIWSEISKKSLVKTSGKTPWASLNTIMLFHAKPEYKNKIYFKIHSKSPMRYILASLDSPDLTTPEKIEEVVERNLLYSITSKDLNWKKLSLYNNNENIEYEISNCSEYTYIIEDKAHATIKIGKTKNDPEIRFNQLKTANPSIKLIHVFPSDQWSEIDLHDKFNEYQKDLEWFFYTKGLKNFLDEEMKKHNKIISSFKKKKDLEESEKLMLEIL